MIASKRLIVAGLVLLLPGCASVPRRASPAAGDCGDFCREIRRCAREGGHASLGARLCHIARCETGDKCIARIDSPGGHHKGPFQFITPTWDSRCPAIFLRHHIERCRGKEAIYDLCCATICAAEMVAEGGAGNWPHCGR